MTAKKMHALGIHNGEQLRACSQAMLMREFGKVGGVYYDFARGIDLRPVEAVRVRKSVGCEHTLERTSTAGHRSLSNCIMRRWNWWDVWSIRISGEIR